MKKEYQYPRVKVVTFEPEVDVLNLVSGRPDETTED